MRRYLRLGAGVAAVLLAGAVANAVPSLTYTLGDPVLVGHQANLPVFVDFDADTTAPTDPSSGLVFLQLDVSTSSGVLVGPGGDYSRFGFLAGPTLANWAEFIGFGPGSSVTTWDLDSAAFPGAAVLDGAVMVSLGTLRVDLTGLAPGSTVSINLFGPDSEGGYEHPVGTADSYDPVPHVGQSAKTVTVPEVVGATVPEPASAALVWLGLGAVAVAAGRRER